MCVVGFFEPETGSEVKGPVCAGKSVIAVGPLLSTPQPKKPKNDEKIFLEVAHVLSEGHNNFEIVSDRAVGANYEEVRIAIQELGFNLLVSVYRRMFENIQSSFGLPELPKE